MQFRRCGLCNIRWDASDMQEPTPSERELAFLRTLRRGQLTVDEQASHLRKNEPIT